MSSNTNLYSKLPKVDDLLANEKIQYLLLLSPRELVIDKIREAISEIREDISNNRLTEKELSLRVNNIFNIVDEKVKQALKPNFKKVINGTGVVIHTNLGRSLISKDIMAHIAEIATNYNNLEFDLERGVRGSRYSHVESIIAKITGAESALVVNNNAAAVMLALSSLGKNKEIIVSRGELVEIGGSFRIPEVMEQSGASLVDVGATNKTHLYDYEKAIGENTAALLKVHTSNYRILGFTDNVSLDELVKLGKQYEIPVIEDLGSGVLIDLSKYGLQYEPTVQESVRAGVDIITFSGDKLLGGPQAGIIIGKKKYIDVMKKHPLNRAMRVDKFTIAALESTMNLYLSEKMAIKQIPTLRMLTATEKELKNKAEKLLGLIKMNKFENATVEIIDEFSQVGGGSMPLEQIPTKCITISTNKISISKLENKLRNYSVPIITRIFKDKLLLDVRTIDESDFEIVVDGLKFALTNSKKECY